MVCCGRTTYKCRSCWHGGCNEVSQWTVTDLACSCYEPIEGQSVVRLFYFICLFVISCLLSPSSSKFTQAVSMDIESLCVLVWVFIMLVTIALCCSRTSKVKVQDRYKVF